MCRVRASLSPSERGLSERDLQCQAGRNGLAKINSAGHMSYWLLLGGTECLHEGLEAWLCFMLAGRVLEERLISSSLRFSCFLGGLALPCDVAFC